MHGDFNHWLGKKLSSGRFLARHGVLRARERDRSVPERTGNPADFTNVAAYSENVGNATVVVSKSAPGPLSVTWMVIV